MDFNLEDRPIGEQIKFIAKFKGYSLKELAEQLNSKFGTKYVQQSISRKISNNTFTYEDLKQFGDILGFTVELKLVD